MATWKSILSNGRDGAFLHYGLHVLRSFLVNAALAMPAFALEQGSAAPGFEIAGNRGAIALADYRGKLVYLDFWASWCGPCKSSFPWMNDLQKRYGARGLTVLAVNLDAKREDANAFLAAMPPNFAYGFDPQGMVARLYGIKGMPTSVLIGPDGRIVLVHQGFRNEEREDLENHIEAGLKHVAR